MQNRLSLADLKAKANVIANTEVYTGGETNCHIIYSGGGNDTREIRDLIRIRN